MKFGVLGSLYAEQRGRSLAPTAPKPAQMLALLLLSENKVVSISQFSAELWDGAPPSSAAAAVHTYIAQLRKALGARRSGTGADRLVTTDAGYRLLVRPGELDLEVFRELAEAGTAAVADKDDELGLRSLRSALSVWRSAALVNMETGPVLRALIEPIERQRLEVLCRRVRVELRLGAHRELLGELSFLVRQNPVHEDLHLQLMVALYRSGRQADALEVFHRLRRELADKLDVAPALRLHRLYEAILLGDPRLDPVVFPRTAMSLDHLTVVGD